MTSHNKPTTPAPRERSKDVILPEPTSRPKNRKEMMTMDIQMECRNCGQVKFADLDEMIEVLIETCDNDSVYAGFFCKDCADDLLDDNF